MRTYRLGLWIVGAVLAVQLGVLLAYRVLTHLVETQRIHVGVGVFASYGYVELGLASLLVAGGIIAAVGTSDARRRWFALFAASIALAKVARLTPWLLSLVHVDVSNPDLLLVFRIGYALHLAALVTLAMASLRGGVHRAFALSTIAVVAAHAVLYGLSLLLTSGPFGIAPAVLSQLLGATAILGVVLAVFLVLDQLGAFPPLVKDGQPSAHLVGHVGGIASGIAVALVVIGVALAALALWGTKQVSSADPNTAVLESGVIIFAVSMSALWRMRGRALGVGWLAAGTVALYIAGRLVLALSVEPVQQVKLVEIKLPGMEISLPDGSVDRTYTYREKGKLEVRTRHADLGPVQLQWTPAEQDPISAFSSIADPTIENRPFSEFAGDVAIQGTVWSMTTMADLHASWRCPGEMRWFVLDISRNAPSVSVIRDVASRIFRSIRCDSATMDAAPALAIEMPHPDVPGELVVRWSVDDAYLVAQSDHLVTLIEQPGPYQSQTLEPLHVLPREHIAETTERPVYELTMADKRVIVSTWHCYGLDISVALFHIGPPAQPREPILEAMRGAHCPH